MTATVSQNFVCNGEGQLEGRAADDSPIFVDDVYCTQTVTPMTAG